MGSAKLRGLFPSYFLGLPSGLWARTWKIECDVTAHSWWDAPVAIIMDSIRPYKQSRVLWPVEKRTEHSIEPLLSACKKGLLKWFHDSNRQKNCRRSPVLGLIVGYQVQPGGLFRINEEKRQANTK